MIDLAPGQRTFLSASDTEQLGQEVSLSSKVLLGASLTNGRAWAITGPENNRSYTLTSDLFRNEGGDVSGSQPAALGVVPFGGSIFRDPLTDVIGTNVANPGDGIVVDISLDPDVPTGDNSDLGIDIRLTREALWFANAAASRAIYYQFPCGFGTRLRSDPPQYQLLSVPCDLPANTTYGELFPDIGDTTKIRIYRFDETFGSIAKLELHSKQGALEAPSPTAGAWHAPHKSTHSLNSMAHPRQPRAQRLRQTSRTATGRRHAYGSGRGG